MKKLYSYLVRLFVVFVVISTIYSSVLAANPKNYFRQSLVGLELEYRQS